MALNKLTPSTSTPYLTGTSAQWMFAVDTDPCSRMSQLARPLRQAAACARLGRQINTSAALAQNDPIQKLFLDKLRDYGTKSK